MAQDNDFSISAAASGMYRAGVDAYNEMLMNFTNKNQVAPKKAVSGPKIGNILGNYTQYMQSTDTARANLNN